MTSPDVYLSLGSNIEPEKNLAEAVRLLRERCSVNAVSSVYQTPPATTFIFGPRFADRKVRGRGEWSSGARIEC